ncbi:cGMP-specific 3',5'-cyclic phosphodiesterase [Kappamyces sp. JEL0829]|nr:cGMP-specific 3',5'-cyclic phosphodiesterase [Kappamyces sp. JEL0829]
MHLSKNTGVSGSSQQPQLSEDQVKKWLLANPEAAERLFRSHQHKDHKIASPEMQQTLFDVAKMLNTSLDLKAVIQKLLHVALSIVNAEKCSLFLFDKENNSLYDIAFDIDSKSNGKPGEKHIVIPMDAYQEPLFNKEIDALTNFCTRTMLCLPVLAQIDQSQEQELMGVACLINKKSPAGAPTTFDENDIQLFKDLLILAGAAIKNAKMYEQTIKLAESNQELFDKARLESNKIKILLEVARLTSSASGVESLTKNILDSAKKFVHAEVSSLFLIDRKKNELYSSVFESNGDQAKIRFPYANRMTSGVAGSVATTGQYANIPNAYLDARFNPEFDKKNNFKTVSMLSVPIFGPTGEIVGVANLINKLDDLGQVTEFSEADLSLFEGIALFCGLALHKTMLIEETLSQRQRLAIVMELISFHARIKPEEINQFLTNEPALFEDKTVLASWQYDPHKFLNTDDNLVAISHQMFASLQYDKQYDIPDFKLIDYLLTVRRNYRPVAYHNFTHAVSVTHALYTLVVNGVLDPYLSKLDMFSMLVAALNHDIDHRGTNNAFQQKTHSVLASFYSTSTMERHHINHCMMLLNSGDGALNILENLSTSDYKKSLELIESSILATDLALFFETKKKVAELIATGGFNKKNPDHLAMLRGVVMTCSDLGAMYKPFGTVRHTADCVYEEFFQQGDEEQRLGIPYTSELTNRSKANEIPRMQIGFYNFVVIPAFECLCSMLGEPVRHLLEGCRENKKEWERLQNSGMPYQHRLGASYK